MRKHLPRSVVVLVFCAVAAFGQQSDWKDYAYPEDGFAISAPVKPTLQKELVDTDAGKVEMHVYYVDLGEMSGFSISVYDFSKFGALPVKDLLQGVKNGDVAGVKGTIVSEKEISLDGAPGIEYEIKEPDGHSRVRCYYVRGKIIVTMSIANTALPFHSATTRLFDSLRFLKPEK
jgi:hypothetical protein